MSMSGSTSRAFAIARLHGFDIVRRRLVLVLLVALPVLLYAAVPHDNFAVIMVGTLMTLSIGGPAVFVMLSGREIDQRLGLAGFRPGELLAGRFLLLSALGSVTALLFGALVTVVSGPPRVAYLFAGLIVMALIAVTAGMAFGSALPGDLEALLMLMTIVGVQLVAPPDSVLHKLLPFRGPILLLRMGNGREHSLIEVVAATAGWMIATGLVTWIALRRKHPVDNRIAGQRAGDQFNNHP
jgi:hypothetical protein